MANSVLMPKAGISVETCIITEWQKKPGDSVDVGDVLFCYETDKASFECESSETGTLLEVFFAPGDEVPVLTPVCAIGNPGEDVAALRPASVQTAPAAPAQDVAAATPVAQFSPPLPLTSGKGVSPRARAFATRQHIDFTQAQGSGPNGRVMERDIRALLSAASPRVAASASTSGLGSHYEDIAFSGIRRAISNSMTASLATIPQLTHSFRFDATAMLALRQNIKGYEAEMGLPNITLGDMVLFAVSRLLLRYPALNAHMLDAYTVRQFGDVHLGFACDTPRGLMVPVIHNANHKTIGQISEEVRSLARKAQDGKISPDDMSGGTFTVSNLGAFGVEHFTPVINPPQTGILGVNNLLDQVRKTAAGIETYTSMGISLTYDHRAIDGAPASRFGKDLCNMLENFPVLLLERG